MNSITSVNGQRSAQGTRTHSVNKLHSKIMLSHFLALCSLFSDPEIKSVFYSKEWLMFYSWGSQLLKLFRILKQSVNIVINNCVCIW